MLRHEYTEQQASEIYDILIDEAGAYPGDRNMFVQWLSVEQAPVGEWRFQGKLGFGGKIFIASVPALNFVSCYREDETNERRAIVDMTTERLRVYGRSLLPPASETVPHPPG